MSDKPLVTIIIPSYNHEQYIGEAIQSVLDQTYQNWELILIDDVSPDRTYEIALALLKNEPRATVFRKEKNGGAVDSYNIGIAKAKGEYIAFLASDDEWKVNFLKTSIHTALKYPNCIIFSNADGIEPYLKSEGVITSAQMRKVLLRRNPIVAIGCLYPATFIKSIYPIDESIYLEDYYLRWRAVLLGYSHYAIKQNLVRYRVLSNSMSSNQIKMIKGRLQLFLLVKFELNIHERMEFIFFGLMRSILSAIK